MARRGPMSGLERIVIGAAGLLVAAVGMTVVAYAGAILRWECRMTDLLVNLIS